VRGSDLCTIDPLLFKKYIRLVGLVVYHLIYASGLIRIVR
jgi:hypothetical protein